jgi:hypothetical protein
LSIRLLVIPRKGSIAWQGDLVAPVALKGEGSKFLISPELVEGCKVEWPDVDLD